MSTIEVKVPDIGDFKDVPIIEVFVKPGDEVKAEDSLVTLESDKATMDVPAPTAGTVGDLRVKLGDKVSEGNVILTLETTQSGAAKPAPAPSRPEPSQPPKESSPAPPARASAARSAAAGEPTLSIVRVPDIGDFKDVPVIEVFVKPGDEVKAEDALVTLESDKATMDVPAPSAGVVRELKVKLGDKVSEGSELLTLEPAEGPTSARPAAPSA
ncbi:MAG TPA: biotin/lipoyl-containing protein, partial [Casimicrobiaceae bacterium]|nr:biotin/lipoyl-containing protein [Casimicrobiaceae bacterium]